METLGVGYPIDIMPSIGKIGASEHVSYEDDFLHYVFGKPGLHTAISNILAVEETVKKSVLTFLIKIARTLHTQCKKYAAHRKTFTWAGTEIWLPRFNEPSAIWSHFETDEETGGLQLKHGAPDTIKLWFENGALKQSVLHMLLMDPSAGFYRGEIEELLEKFWKILSYGPQNEGLELDIVKMGAAPEGEEPSILSQFAEAIKPGLVSSGEHRLKGGAIDG